MGLRNANLSQFSQECYRIASEKGWWEDYPTTVREDWGGLLVHQMSADTILSKLMLGATELAEATEIARSSDFDALAIWPTGMEGTLYTEVEHGDRRLGGPLKPEGFGIETVDVIIRMLDLNRALGIDTQRCYELKTAYNESRPHRHGGKRA